MHAVAPAVWDALANPPGARKNPFVSHAFLHALEASGSATAETGWQPAHVLVEDRGTPIAAAPLSSSRLSASRGISPDAKPTTRNRPPHAIARSAASENSVM